MRMTSVAAEAEVTRFAERAAKRLGSDSALSTYTDGPIKQGDLFAIRMGMGDDCVLVFRLDSEFEPVNFAQIIPK
jgi:hypothetical protein